MNNQENVCPCCPNHCSLQALGCEKGEEYVRNGGSIPEDNRKSHTRGRHKMPDLTTTTGKLCACGHMLHHGNGSDEAIFAALSNAEQKELDRLLQKLLESWKGNHHV